MEQTQEQNAWLEEIKALEQAEQLLEGNRLGLYFQKGRLLSNLKNSVPHGQFLPLLKAGGLKMSARNAQHLIELAANEELFRSSNAPNLAHLTIEKAAAIIWRQTEDYGIGLKISFPISVFAIEYAFPELLGCYPKGK